LAFSNTKYPPYPFYNQSIAGGDAERKRASVSDEVSELRQENEQLKPEYQHQAKGPVKFK
jgi:hypothetical protein